jgi:HPt (histidine-containing phosphotransfer) domain-containing protein
MRSHPGAVDLSNLEAVCQNGESFNTALLRELVGHFVEQNRLRLDQAADAIDAGNRETLRDLAHAVKGSAALLGAGRLHDLAFSLEHRAEPGEPQELRSAVAGLNREFSAVLDAVRARHPNSLSPEPFGGLSRSPIGHCGEANGRAPCSGEAANLKRA